MYCYNCGEKISDDAAFCYKCGAKVKGVQETGGAADTKVNVVQSNAVSAKAIDEDFLKQLLAKIAFLVVSIVVFYIMKSNIFLINEYDRWGLIKEFKEAGISQTVDFIEEKIENDYEINDEEKKMYVTALHIAKWCIFVGAFGYIIAAVVAFFGIEILSHLLTIISCILHGAFAVIFTVVTKTAFTDLSNIIRLPDIMWLYVLLNIVLCIISYICFWGLETETETNSLIEKSAAYERKFGTTVNSANTWRCVECGKINQGYTYTCSCGNAKK